MAPTLVSLIIFKISENPFDYQLNTIPQHLKEKIIEASFALQITPFFTKKVKRYFHQTDNLRVITKQIILKHKIVVDTEDGEGSKHFYFRYYKRQKKEEMSKGELQQPDVQGAPSVQETLLRR